MVAIKIKGFGGQLPGMDEHLLPDANASFVKNAWLQTGALQGMYEPHMVHACQTPLTRKVYRIPLANFTREYITSSFWMEFQDPDTDVLRTPIANDNFERYYWASPSITPQYNTRARILAGSASFVLGIPQPGSAPTITVAGGTAANVVRAYVYTWVSAYGEEGPPSGPALATNHPDGTWTIGLTAPTSGDTTNRNIATANIYRTITSTAGVATYFFVATVPIATLTYADSNLDLAISANRQLASAQYTAPPTDLKGFVSMPNGMIAGFRGNEVWYCEPFLPHAWPVNYTINVDYPIVGLGVVGQALVILTTTYPYVASGVNPSSVSNSKIGIIMPCLSRGSIVANADGVNYASADGVASVANGSVSIISSGVVDKVAWLDSLYVRSLRFANLNGALYAWGSIANGCFEPTAFDPLRFEQNDATGSRNGVYMNVLDQRQGWTTLTNDTPIDNTFNDPWTNEVFILHGNNVYWVDTSESEPHQVFLWRSKKFQTEQLKNLSVARVWFDLPTGVSLPEQPVDNTLVQTLSDDQLGLLRVYADDALVLTWEMRTTGEMIRLPADRKTAFWQFEIEGRVRVLNLETATTPSELGGV